MRPGRLEQAQPHYITMQIQNSRGPPNLVNLSSEILCILSPHQIYQHISVSVDVCDQNSLNIFLDQEVFYMQVFLGDQLLVLMSIIVQVYSKQSVYVVIVITHSFNVHFLVTHSLCAYTWQRLCTCVCMSNSMNHISLNKKRQAQMLCKHCKVTHCARHVSANTRLHQLHWYDSHYLNLHY